MEVNRDESLRCIEIALTARSSGDLFKSERFLKKSIQLFPSQQAEEMLGTVEKEIQNKHKNNNNNNNNTQSQSAQSGTSYSSAPSSSSTSSASSSSTSSSSSSASSSRPTSSSSSTSSRPTYSSSSTPSPSSSSSSSSSSSPPPSSAAKPFTPEQREAARSLKKLTNFYDILGIAKTSTDSEIKIAYRKMALKFHPDKNGAPEAEDAFKKVSQAFQTLSDGNKRAHYDQFGDEETASRGGFSGMGGAQHQRGDDFSPEDIFNMFFNGMSNNGGGGGGGVHFRRFNMGGGTRRRQQQQNEGGAASPSPAGGLMQFVQFLPIVFLILLSFLSSPSSSDNDYPFSLDRSSTSPFERTTQSSHLPYFVNNNFGYKYGRDARALSNVEHEVEIKWANRWDEECGKAKKEMNNLKEKARATEDPGMRDSLNEKARDVDMESCEKRRTMFMKS